MSESHETFNRRRGRRIYNYILRKRETRRRPVGNCNVYTLSLYVALLDSKQCKPWMLFTNVWKIIGFYYRNRLEKLNIICERLVHSMRKVAWMERSLWRDDAPPHRVAAPLPPAAARFHRLNAICLGNITRLANCHIIGTSRVKNDEWASLLTNQNAQLLSKFCCSVFNLEYVVSVKMLFNLQFDYWVWMRSFSVLVLNSDSS